MAFVDSSEKKEITELMDNFTEKSLSQKEKNVTSISDAKTGKNSENILGQFKDGRNIGNQEFKDKKKEFLRKTDLLFDLAKSEENEAAVSDIDDKLVKSLAYQGRKCSDNASFLKSEIKTMQREAKKNSTGNEGIIQKKSSPFMESGYEFTNRMKQFTNPCEDRFRTLGQDVFGNDIFLSNREESLQAKALLVQKKFGDTKNEDKYKEKTDVEKSKKFDVTTISDDENKSNKSTNSYFSNEAEQKSTSESQQRFTSNEERYSKANKQRETKQKEYSKETKKAARITAVSNLLRAKSITQNQMANMSGEVTGDLMKDGAGFLQVIIQSLLEAIKNKIKVAIINAFASFFSFLASVISAIAPIIITIVIILIITTSFFGIFIDGVDVPVGDGYTFASLSDGEIDEIIERLYILYPSMCEEHELLLEYALSKVGCEYNQNYHWSLTEDIFDCSSLAYRSYLQIGINISNQGIYSAAEECRMVVEGMHLASGELMPGDLIFYGGNNNDRYMGVYHVAIYVGDGKMVEARGISWGVVYCDVRTSNVVAYGRYI